MSIIAVTGWDENQHTQSAGPGFDARLVKPVDFGQLLDVLELARTVPRAPA